MAIEVRIPTILRTYTGGEKAVEAKGDTLAGLIDDLESRHAGIKGRLITEEGALHRFVNIYVNDEDIRFTGGLGTAVSDGSTIVILPAVAGG
jgi:MoaD family protein